MSHVDDGRLHAHLDGALTPEERAATEAHLAECADCRANLERARRFRARSRQLLALAAPDAVEPPPFDAIRARAEARRTAAPNAAARIPASGNSDRGPVAALDAGAAPRRRLPRGLAWAAVAVLALGLAGLARTLVLSPSPERRLASAAGEAAPVRARSGPAPAAAPADRAVAPADRAATPAGRAAAPADRAATPADRAATPAGRAAGPADAGLAAAPTDRAPAPSGRRTEPTAPPDRSTEPAMRTARSAEPTTPAAAAGAAPAAPAVHAFAPARAHPDSAAPAAAATPAAPAPPATLADREPIRDPAAAPKADTPASRAEPTPPAPERTAAQARATAGRVAAAQARATADRVAAAAQPGAAAETAAAKTAAAAAPAAEASAADAPRRRANAERALGTRIRLVPGLPVLGIFVVRDETGHLAAEAFQRLPSGDTLQIVQRPEPPTRVAPPTAPAAPAERPSARAGASALTVTRDGLYVTLRAAVPPDSLVTLLDRLR